MKVKTRNMLCTALLLFLIVVIFGMLRSAGNVLAGDMGRSSEDKNRTYIEYHVKYGDSLWSIADEHKGSAYRSTGDYIRDVEEINHIENSDRLYEGQILVLPVTAD